MVRLRNTRRGHQEDPERFRGAFEAAATGMALVGLDGTWLEANETLCEILGYTIDELDGLKFQDVIHPDYVEAYLERVQEMVAGTTSRSQTEIGCVPKQGLFTWIVLTVALARDAKEAPLYLNVQVQDIANRRRVEGALRTVAVEQSATLATMRHRALHDALTDLPNRTLFRDRLEQSILTAQRQGMSFALLFLDLDRFKQVNDTLGHSVGDLLLQQVAQRLRGTLRASDTIARMGGDEFAIVLQGDEEEGAHLVAQKILQCLEMPLSIEGVALHVGASVGVAIYPRHGDTAEILMRRADVAMYVAKRERIGYITYSPSHDENTPSRLALAAELRHATEDGQLLLHYQPKIDLRSGQMRGVESLMRWQHPEHGLIPPSEFVPVAEQAGFITPLTHWVIDSALKQCRQWQESGISLQTAINLSAINLHDGETVAYISDQLFEIGVDSDLLEVEITETALMEDPDRSLQTLTRLHELGVRIAIDHFGIGYSSLAYLARLPVDVSKIDKSFVRELAVDAPHSTSSTVVRSMIELSHSLGLQVVGEGIESKEVLGVLTDMHCDQAQGFYLCPPVVAEDIPARWKAAAAS